MNEAFSDALEAAGASPTPIQGNTVVVGKAGIFTLGRFNISAGIWHNGRCSRARRAMAYGNRAIEPLVQPGLFETRALFAASNEISTDTAFFVACFSGSLKHQPDAPLSVDIAVPEPHMNGWLFREPLALFAQRYEVVTQQLDAAVPVLKSDVLQRREGT
ncbi:alpha/beta hydrolase [Cupriavidus oxalaticus]|uniref:alpha/beta hydrolase n=1 Tax=Cupriavidus oxalaticus TaxID=96344 RepID=UPI00317A91C5